MGLVKDKNVMADVDGEEEEFVAGMWFGNNYIILDCLSINPHLPFEGNEPLIPLISYMVTLTLAYPWVEG